MVEIKIYNPDGTRFPGEFLVHARTPREALKGLKLFPEFDPRLQSSRFLSKVDGCKQVEDLDDVIEGSEITLRIEEVLTHRTMLGSGNSPYVRIVIGVLMIVAAFFLAEANPEVALVLASAGFSLIIGGVIQLLTPGPEKDKDTPQNYSNKTYPNTTKSGTPMPIILGEHMWGGHIFSVNVDTKKGLGYSLYSYVDTLWEYAFGYDSWATVVNPKAADPFWTPGGVPGLGGYPGWHLNSSKLDFGL